MANRAARRRAEKLARIEGFDNFATARKALSGIAAGVGEWAGIPMPIEDQPMVVHPSYKFAQLFQDTDDKARAANGNDQAPETQRLVNSWWSDRLRSTVVIFEENGRRDWGLIPGVHSFKQTMQTLGASDAWGIEQEANAQQLLAALVRHRQMKQYLLTGMFLETSPRSNITYLFRRLRPTIAILTAKGESKILAALCLHPIAYYEGSWAGAMCPTDDVIAHLMLMRGDEPMFWRRANQHPSWRPEAGL